MEIKIPLRLSQLVCFAAGILIANSVHTPAQSETCKSAEGYDVTGPVYFCNLMKLKPEERSFKLQWDTFRLISNSSINHYGRGGTQQFPHMSVNDIYTQLKD